MKQVDVWGLNHLPKSEAILKEIFPIKIAQDTANKDYNTATR